MQRSTTALPDDVTSRSPASPSRLAAVASFHSYGSSSTQLHLSRSSRSSRVLSRWLLTLVGASRRPGPSRLVQRYAQPRGPPYREQGRESESAPAGHPTRACVGRLAHLGSAASANGPAARRLQAAAARAFRCRPMTLRAGLTSASMAGTEIRAVAIHCPRKQTRVA
jgi:hypothetical protein